MTTRSPLLHVSHLIRTLRPPHLSHRLLTTSASRHAPDLLPSIPTCPPSSCACAEMPEGLAIDHEKQLKGTMPPYAQHVVIRTGRDDWESRIEDGPGTSGAQVRGGLGGSNLARILKELVGEGGKFHNPSHPVLITNSSGRRGVKDPGDRHVLQIFPQNLYFPQLPDIPEVIEDFAWRFLTAERREFFVRKRGMGRMTKNYRDFGRKGDESVLWYRITAPTVLICGHMSRDSRCGILGPILKAEFEEQIWESCKNLTGFMFLRSKIEGQVPLHPLSYRSISLCSHVGGHAFAGNVIIYFPTDYKLAEGGVLSPLAGKSVWYGRVEPRHVNGIVNETLLGGKVIDELLRGVHEFPGFTPVKREGKQDIENGRGKFFVNCQ